MKFIRKLRGWIQRWISFTDNRALLSYVLEAANPKAELADRLEWFEQLINWIRHSGSITNENLKDKGQIHSVRIRFIFQLLDRNPVWRENLALTLRSILQESSGVSLYSETGLANEFGLGSEIIARLVRRITPVPPNHANLAQIFNRTLNSYEDAIWVKNLAPEVKIQLESLLYEINSPAGLKLKKSLAQDMYDALLILSAKVESLGLAPEIRDRLSYRRIVDSPFFQLHRAISNLEGELNLEVLLSDCARDIQNVYTHLETLGVSVAVVYRLDILTKSLERIRILAGLIELMPSDSEATENFIASLIQENIRKNSVRELLKDQLRLLAKKIVERTGISGEHYIARDRGEWLHMITSAAGGGFITTFTAYFKIIISRLALAPFFEGGFFWFDYSLSFLLMQFMGFTLATKQPSATAPALAGKLKQIEQEHQLEQFVDEVIRIVRSQFAAAVGNLGLVIPTSLLFGAGYQYFTGHSFLTLIEAQHTIASFHPFKTLTILNASITGVLLWVSSISGGWFENWMVYNNISAAISHNRSLNLVFGKKLCENFATKFLKNIAGIGANLTLGLALAFVPILTRFFGFTLEVKHVTLSAGALSFALTSMPRAQLDLTALFFASFGILIIGVLNFAISFLLAMYVAQRAREVPLFWVFKLARAVARRFLKHPFAFFFAPVQSSLENEFET